VQPPRKYAQRFLAQMNKLFNNVGVNTTMTKKNDQNNNKGDIIISVDDNENTTVQPKWIKPPKAHSNNKNVKISSPKVLPKHGPNNV
jgi:hypothetical protein